MELKTGDSVRVKAGVLEPDTEEFEIGGWQGRIVETNTTIPAEGTLVSIEWDVETLQHMPAEYIIQSEIEGLGWELMILSEQDLEKVVSRDSVSDVKKMQEELSEKYYWSSFGEEGIRIATVLEGIDRNDEKTCFATWHGHLASKLSFPIKAVVSESEENELIPEGEKVTLTSLSTINNRYGILVTVNWKDRHYEFPLCDLEVPDDPSENYFLLTDYVVWFANR
ncbi:MAG: calcium-binding protein [Bacteroidota bacterium]|nr:calcium-binding protein [Bacteroidota bacterium]